MSSEDRKQTRDWLSALWKIYTDDIIKLRSLDADAIQKYTSDITDQLRATGGDGAQLALKLGFIDKLLTREQSARYIRKVTGNSQTAIKEKHISSKSYLKLVQEKNSSSSSTNNIAILIAEGNIVPGKQPVGLIGADSLSEIIRKARKDTSIKSTGPPYQFRWRVSIRIRNYQTGIA